MRETFQSQSQITHKSRFVWGGYSPCSNACRRVQIPPFSFSAYLQNFLSHWHPAIQGGSAPRSNPLPFYIPFLTEKVPLQYTFYWHWYPFHNPSLELCILLNCCKCTVLKIWINHKTRPFTLLFSQLWYICQPFLGFFQPKWQFSLPFHLLQQVKSQTSHILEAWKWYPFQVEPLRIGHFRQYPPGFKSALNFDQQYVFCIPPIAGDTAYIS